MKSKRIDGNTESVRVPRTQELEKGCEKEETVNQWTYECGTLYLCSECQLKLQERKQAEKEFRELIDRIKREIALSVEYGDLEAVEHIIDEELKNQIGGKDEK